MRVVGHASRCAVFMRRGDTPRSPECVIWPLCSQSKQQAERQGQQQPIKHAALSVIDAGIMPTLRRMRSRAFAGPRGAASR